MDMSQGNPAPPASGGRARAHWIVVGSIFVVGLIVGVILTGAAGAQTPSPSPTAKAKHFKGFGHGLGHGRFGGGIHGEFVVPKPGGGYQTVLTQIGTVQSVSGSSITVKSEDGYTHTYGVDNDTLVAAGNNGITDVAKGDTVRVLAVGSKAKQIIDATKVQSLRQKYWKQKPQQSESPEPSSSSSASKTSANI
jgi:hypothetical protein